jgi:hypothetical protein
VSCLHPPQLHLLLLFLVQSSEFISSAPGIGSEGCPQ